MLPAYSPTDSVTRLSRSGQVHSYHTCPRPCLPSTSLDPHHHRSVLGYFSRILRCHHPPVNANNRNNKCISPARPTAYHRNILSIRLLCKQVRRGRDFWPLFLRH